MHNFTQIFRSSFIIFFFYSNFLLASSRSLGPKFGIVKSKDSVIYLSCSTGSDGHKKCFIYLEKKGEMLTSITKELNLVKILEGSKRLFSTIDRSSKEELTSASYMPLTTLALGLTMTKGEKFIPMFLLSSLDLVASPFGLMADGFYRLYKIIQGTYLKRAWRTILGLNNTKSMSLTQKDFKELVKLIKKSTV